MTSLQCFKDKDKLVAELLNNKHNTEKIVYFLLLDRKLRQPSEEDAEEVKAKSSIYNDPPRKRVDVVPLSPHQPRFSLGSLTDGSPLAPRRALTVHQWRRNWSLQNCNSSSSVSITSLLSSSSSHDARVAPSSSSTHIDSSHGNKASPRRLTTSSSTVQSSSDNCMYRQQRRQHSLQNRQHKQSPSSSSYRHKLLQLTQQQKKIQQHSKLNKQSAVDKTTSPITKQKQQSFNSNNNVASAVNNTNSNNNNNTNATTNPPPSSPSTSQVGPWKARLHSLKNSFLGSPRFHRKKMTEQSTEDFTITPGSSSEFTKKSWFGALMGVDREEQCFVMIKDKNMGQVKSDLIHALLRMPDLSHTVLSPTSFLAEYRRANSSSVFSRHVKMQVDIAPVLSDSSVDTVPHLHCLTFSLISGPTRRFKRLCELFQSMLSTNRKHGDVSIVTRRMSSQDLREAGSINFSKSSLFDEANSKSTKKSRHQRRSQSQSDESQSGTVLKNDVTNDVTCDPLISEVASLVSSTHI